MFKLKSSCVTLTSTEEYTNATEIMSRLYRSTISFTVSLNFNRNGIALFFLLCLFSYIPSFKVIINTSQNNVWRNSRVNTYCPCPIKLRPNVKKCHSKQRDQVDLDIDSKQIY